MVGNWCLLVAASGAWATWHWLLQSPCSFPRQIQDVWGKARYAMDYFHVFLSLDWAK